MRIEQHLFGGHSRVGEECRVFENEVSVRGGGWECREDGERVTSEGIVGAY
jgi:hypothetical protein